MDIKKGDHILLTQSVWDDGEDHHPPGWFGRAGDEVIVVEVRGNSAYVRHEDVTDNSFLIYADEYKKLERVFKI